VTIDTVGLTYDALGRMIQQNRAGVYTQILYSPVGKTAIMNGQTRKTINLPLPGGATAVYDTNVSLPLQRLAWQLTLFLYHQPHQVL